MATYLRRVGAVAVLALAAACPMAVGPSPAAAQAPVLTVTPDQLVHNQVATVTMTGFPPGYYGLMQCQLRDADGYMWPFDDCMFLTVFDEGVPPASVEVTVPEEFAAFYGNPVDCATTPHGCVVMVTDLDSDIGNVVARAPLAFPSRLVPTPNRNLASGDTVSVAAADVPPGAWSVAQCTATYAHERDPATTAGQCGEPTALTQAGEAASGDVVVADPFVATDGTAHPCGYTGCALVLSAPAHPARTFGLVSFGPPTVSFTPAAPLVETAWLTVSMAGIPGDRASVHQCAEPVGPGMCSADHDDDWPFPLDGLGTATMNRAATARFVSPEGSVTHDCRATACSLVVEVDGAIVASTPVTFRPPFEFTITPSEGLLDGQPITVQATSLTPGATYPVRRCGTRVWECEPVGEYLAPPSGLLSVTVPASQRVGDGTYCRQDDCVLLLQGDVGDGLASYSMAEGEVSVTPAGGLTDGQTVQVTGSDLMSTYAGRSLGPFPTGGWVVTQCDSAVVDAPSLYAALDGCSAAGTRAVSVDASTLDEPIAVQASMTTFLGRTVDCTQPDACVVGLYRLEQDGSSTLWTAPVDVT